jgi:hypothetical protein
MVTTWAALVVFTVTLPKFNVDGVATRKFASDPWPLKGTTTGLLMPLEVIVSVPVTGASLGGVNATVAVQ